MAFIYKPPKKERPKRKIDNKYKNNSKVHKYVYNTTNWKKIRLEYLKIQPLCEICKLKNKLKFAVQVHHKHEISKGKTIQEMQMIGFNFNNLQALCEQCHREVHKK